MNKGVVLVTLGLVFAMTGCQKELSKGVASGSSVDKVLEQQISNANAIKNEDQIGNIENEKVVGINDEVASEETSMDTEVSEDIDIDLTQMSSDMVYVVVYQLMVEPDKYIGKTIKMEGNYQNIFYDPTNTYYHYCVIEDATACCAQGMEFVWEDGSHLFPDEYPSEGDTIAVTGEFETYREEGDEKLYCRLKDASMEVVKKKKQSAQEK